MLTKQLVLGIPGELRPDAGSRGLRWKRSPWDKAQTPALAVVTVIYGERQA